MTGVADDLYLMSNSQTKLQALIDIAEKYGQQYRIKYGANKTKITVVGSTIDMQYYKDVAPWQIAQQNIDVTENNEHLGQIVSGTNQISKNIDQSLKKGRASIFGLLGPAFAFKCLLGPLVKIHLFRTFTCPRLRSGLSSFALRRNQITPLSLFHRKTLKGILHLSQSSPSPAIHFLLGELPVEGKIHRDMFSLFYSIWCNPQSKIYQIVKHILNTSPESSTTWAINLRHICRMYKLEDPLAMLQRDPLPKGHFREIVFTKILAFHENELRTAASSNSKMKYLNVACHGLRGRHHPCLSDIKTVTEVRKLRPHLKFLTCDYLTHQTKFDHTQMGNPLCRSCEKENETISHIVAKCAAYAMLRKRLLSQLEEACPQIVSGLDMTEEETCTQFILDPSSLNLTSRMNIDDQMIPTVFSYIRDFCFNVHNERVRRLSNAL